MADEATPKESAPPPEATPTTPPKRRRTTSTAAAAKPKTPRTPTGTTRRASSAPAASPQPPPPSTPPPPPALPAVASPMRGGGRARGGRGRGRGHTRADAETDSALPPTSPLAGTKRPCTTNKNGGGGGAADDNEAAAEGDGDGEGDYYRGDDEDEGDGDGDGAVGMGAGGLLSRGGRGDRGAAGRGGGGAGAGTGTGAGGAWAGVGGEWGARAQQVGMVYGWCSCVGDCVRVSDSNMVGVFNDEGVYVMDGKCPVVLETSIKRNGFFLELGGEPYFVFKPRKFEESPYKITGIGWSPVVTPLNECLLAVCGVDHFIGVYTFPHSESAVSWCLVENLAEVIWRHYRRDWKAVDDATAKVLYDQALARAESLTPKRHYNKQNRKTPVKVLKIATKKSPRHSLEVQEYLTVRHNIFTFNCVAWSPILCFPEKQVSLVAIGTNHNVCIISLDTSKSCKGIYNFQFECEFSTETWNTALGFSPAKEDSQGFSTVLLAVGTGYGSVYLFQVQPCGSSRSANLPSSVTSHSPLLSITGLSTIVASSMRAITTISWSPDRTNRTVVCCASWMIYTWNEKDNKTTLFPGHQCLITGVAWVDQQSFLTSSLTGVKKWSAYLNEQSVTYDLTSLTTIVPKAVPELRGIASSPNRCFFATVVRNPKIKTGNVVKLFNLHESMEIHFTPLFSGVSSPTEPSLDFHNNPLLTVLLRMATAEAPVCTDAIDALKNSSFTFVATAFSQIVTASEAAPPLSNKLQRALQLCHMIRTSFPQRKLGLELPQLKDKLYFLHAWHSLQSLIGYGELHFSAREILSLSHLIQFCSMKEPALSGPVCNTILKLLNTTPEKLPIETCPVCNCVVPFESPTHCKCEKGHEFTRCMRTMLLVCEVDSLVCWVCGGVSPGLPHEVSPVHSLELLPQAAKSAPATPKKASSTLKGSLAPPTQGVVLPDVTITPPPQITFPWLSPPGQHPQAQPAPPSSESTAAATPIETSTTQTVSTTVSSASTTQGHYYPRGTGTCPLCGIPLRRKQSQRVIHIGGLEATASQNKTASTQSSPVESSESPSSLLVESQHPTPIADPTTLTRFRHSTATPVRIHKHKNLRPKYQAKKKPKPSSSSGSDSDTNDDASESSGTSDTSTTGTSAAAVNAKKE
ncbi:hypothetical protein Pelo_14102 [Pelomyxa schiedti]|nr:hypothetical protein Pelo_14102 [Pelomyxa schiedti]